MLAKVMGYGHLAENPPPVGLIALGVVSLVVLFLYTDGTKERINLLPALWIGN